jgi:periplasmic protein CpxP/Spy
MRYIVMAALLMAGVATYAQEPVPVQKKPARERMKKLTAEERAKNLTTRLELSTEQEAKVKVLYEEQDKATDELKAKPRSGTAREDMTALVQELKASRQQFKVKMKDILTPEQYTKWQSENQNSRYESLKKQEAEEHKSDKAAVPPEN